MSWCGCVHKGYTDIFVFLVLPTDSLHGDSVSAQLSRVVWLYLNSGQQLYLEAVKGLVLQYAQAGLACYHCLNPGHSLELAS